MKHLAQLTRCLSLEDLDGKAEREVELTIYAELSNLLELEQGSYEREKHEQWKLPLQHKEVRGRLRLIDDTVYTMCFKRPNGPKGSNVEVEQEITEDTFKILRETACDGYIKTRYKIPALGTDLVWEVDVFNDQAGKLHPWVKIDLELEHENQEIPQFPLSVAQFIYADSNDLTSAEKQQIDRLWSREWSKLDGIRDDLEPPKPE